jgi:hypothetical protein
MILKEQQLNFNDSFQNEDKGHIVKLTVYNMLRASTIMATTINSKIIAIKPRRLKAAITKPRL